MYSLILIILHFTSFVTTYTNKYISVKLLCVSLYITNHLVNQLNNLVWELTWNVNFDYLSTIPRSGCRVTTSNDCPGFKSLNSKWQQFWIPMFLKIWILDHLNWFLIWGSELQTCVHTFSRLVFIWTFCYKSIQGSE